MLLVLHAALDTGFGSAMSAALLTAHLGLFFLWQPIWQKDQRLDLTGTLLIVLLVVAMLVALSWWIAFGWLIILVGIVAGRSFSTRQERYVYMLSLAFLVSELLITCTAKLFLEEPFTPDVAQAARIGLYIPPALLYAIPPITVPQREPFPVDFFRGITFALMTALLAVFSVLMTLSFKLDYPAALVATLLALGLVLLFLSWIITPGPGNTGLRTLWEKSLLNIGTPFEAWLGNIANLARQQSSASEFLDAAIGELVDIPWVSGAEWRSTCGNGTQGEVTPHNLTVATEELTVTLCTRDAISSALLIHCRLLIQVLGYFFIAKRRENEQANQAHMRAIYETGARVTHDIKNLLQSMQAMASAVQSTTDVQQERRGFALLKRQLPAIVQRLRLALDNLQQPSAQAHENVPVGDWWKDVGQRLRDIGIHCQSNIEDADVPIPRECFDSIVDNLIDNARSKGAPGAGLRINFSVVASGGQVRCEVRDNGTAMDAGLAAQLFEQPVASATGLGIGLYQAARQAQLAGFELRLAANRDGDVRFELASTDAAQAGLDTAVQGN